MNNEHNIIRLIGLIFSFLCLIFSIIQIVSSVKVQFAGAPTSFLLFILSVAAIWKLLTEKGKGNEE
jgi:hypothetical protein